MGRGQEPPPQHDPSTQQPLRPPPSRPGRLFSYNHTSAVPATNNRDTAAATANNTTTAAAVTTNTITTTTTTRNITVIHIPTATSPVTTSTTTTAAYIRPSAPPAALIFSPTPAATPSPASPPFPLTPAAAKRWLGVGRTEQQPSTSTTTTTTTHLPVTPPSKFKRLKIFIKSARKERRKKEEKRRQGATDDSVGDKATTRGPRSRTHADEPPARNKVDQCTPSRRSFRLTARDDQSMLPLWLEEKPRVPSPSLLNTNSVREISNTENGSFETRWDSLLGKNKVYSSCPSGPRPPGWDDIGNLNKLQHNPGNSKSDHCTSFDEPNLAHSTNNKSLFSSQTSNSTGNDQPYISLSSSSITGNSQEAMPPPTCGSSMDTQLPIPNTENEQMPGSQITETTENTPLPLLSLPENQRSWSDEFSEVNQHSSVSSWDNVHVSQTSDLNFSDSYLGERRHSIPTSNLASESALSSLASGDYTSTKIIDRHMWASSDSFFCEDFTFCNRKGKVTLDQPRSYSQVLIRENQSEKSNDHSQASDDNEPSHDFSPGDTPEGIIFSPMGLKEVPDTPPLDRLSLGGESACVSSDSPHVTHSERDAFKDNYNSTIHYNSDSTQHHTDTTPTGREHWIQFDGGSQDQLNLDILVAQGAFTPPPLSFNLQSEMPDSQASDDSAAVTPSSPSENCKSILSTIESGMVHSSGSYRGRLIRTYSQRGRRASKRVMNSVSRRMGQPTQDYGKVPEPKPPMYSKAVMTMQIGPGLFQQPTFTCDRSEDETGSARSAEETKVNDEGKSSSLSDTMATTSFLETARAERVGSLRMPRLSSALVRRSLSLNTPRVEQGEVPFQRLSEHRRGSFRKALSGLGALARSFRRKSNSGPKVGSPDGSKKNNPVQASKTINEIPSRETPQNGRRTESFKGGQGRQTPQAPRLPRRTITHKSVESEYPRQRPLQK